MSHYSKQRLEYANWVNNIDQVPDILENPTNYSKQLIESIIAGYETYHLTIDDNPPSNYLKLIDIINNREK